MKADKVSNFDVSKNAPSVEQISENIKCLFCNKVDAEVFKKQLRQSFDAPSTEGLKESSDALNENLKQSTSERKGIVEQQSMKVSRNSKSRDVHSNLEANLTGESSSFFTQKGVGYQPTADRRYSQASKFRTKESGDEKPAGLTHINAHPSHRASSLRKIPLKSKTFVSNAIRTNQLYSDESLQTNSTKNLIKSNDVHKNNNEHKDESDKINAKFEKITSKESSISASELSPSKAHNIDLMPTLSSAHSSMSNIQNLASFQSSKVHIDFVKQQIKEQIIDRILVSSSDLNANRTVTIQLSPRLLENTDIHFSKNGDILSVQFVSDNKSSLQFLQKNQADLQAHLQDNLKNFKTISVYVQNASLTVKPQGSTENFIKSLDFFRGDIRQTEIASSIDSKKFNPIMESLKHASGPNLSQSQDGRSRNRLDYQSVEDEDEE